MKMSKQQFLARLADLYRVGNIADHESNPNDWTKPEMAGPLVCQHFDQMLRDLVKGGVISEEEHQTFIDTLL